VVLLAFIFVPIVIAGMVAGVVAVAFAFVAGKALGLDNVNTIRVTSGLVAVLAVAFGLRWWLAWSLVVPVTVLEGSGVRASLRRSKLRTKGSRGRVFVICLVLLILGAIVSWVIQLPVLFAIGLRSLSHPESIGAVVQAVSATGVFVSTCLVGALLTIALTLIYYDQRV